MELAVSDSDDTREGSASRHGEFFVEDLSMGRWPFARDPKSATAAVATKSMPALSMILNKGLAKVRTCAMDEQSCLSLRDSAVTEKEKAAPCSVIVRMKRRAETLDTLGNKETANKTLQKWNCSLCGITVTSETTLKYHIQGKKHKIKEVSSKFIDPTKTFSSECDSNRLHCSLCKVYIPSEKRLRVHLQGKKHRKKEASMAKPLQHNVSDKISNVGSEGNDQKVIKENDDLGCVSEEEIVQNDPENDYKLFNEPIPVVGEHEQVEKMQEISKKPRLEEYWHCEMCNVTCNDDEEMRAHMNCNEHMSSLLMIKDGGGVIDMPEEAMIFLRESPENGQDVKELQVA